MVFSELSRDCRQALERLKAKYSALSFHLDVDGVAPEDMPIGAYKYHSLPKYSFHKSIDLYDEDETDLTQLSCKIESKPFNDENT